MSLTILRRAAGGWILLVVAAAAAPALAGGAGGPDGWVDLGATLGAGDLDASRGGHELIVNDMNLQAELYNNAAVATVTGSNAVTNDALSGTSGFATVVQNTGNNVIIQSATILNLTLQ